MDGGGARGVSVFEPNTVDSLFSAGPVVMFKWRNAEGWPVDLVTPNVESLLGVSPDDLLSGAVPYSSLVHPDDLERVAEEVAENSRCGASRFNHAPYRLCTKSRRWIWVDDHTRILRDDTGIATYFVGYLVDITDRIHADEERRELERQFRHAQRLESLGLLAGGIAHDFNNLLTVVIGNATLAKDFLPDALDDVSTALDRIENAARRCAALSQQILAYSGRGALVTEEIDLHELIEDLAELLESSLDGSHRFARELSADLPLVVGDPAQVQQVVLNLLTNASEALANEPGTVTLTTALAFCDAARLKAATSSADATPGRYVGVEVADDGPGMDAETVDRLFEPFFTTKRHGHGLGMSAVLGIVRGHGGFLEIDSQPGSGTKARVWLPAINSTKVRESGTFRLPVESMLAPPSRTATGQCILVVDDNFDVRTTAIAILERHGYRVLTAEDGQEALQRVQATDRIDLILLDLVMPGMSSAECLDRLDGLAFRGKILMHSGYGSEDSLCSLRSRQLPFLEKPWDEAGLLRAVERTLDA